ncbi:MAG: N-6 DNA methylase, partial [Gemmatimonadaceae bacterium]|nr:N-6 DNA methylase [Gemmatimonadaceae bacterium]
MRRSTRLGFEAISIEGGLLTPDFLATIAALEAPRQTPAEYRIPRGIQVRDEIGRAWRIALAHWPDIESAAAAGGSVAAPMTAILRDAFGWTSLVAVSAPRIVGERTFPISASALEGTVPLVFASGGTDLDKPLVNFGDGNKRRSAFGLLQEYLNADPKALWGVATNGLALRITRDNASLTRPAWIEADVARIMREERYADFSALWLLLNESRFGAPGAPPHECPLEAWRAASAAAGTAARERLRDGVEVALRELGNGFLQHPANEALRARLQSGALDPAGYQQQLLRLVYRLIFLLVAEERGLLHPETSDPAARDLYRDGYSLGRLRQRAARRRTYDRHEDVWIGLQIVFRACATGEPRLAIPALGGLFAAHQTPDLDAARIANRFLLAAIYRLTWLEDRDTLVRVNWRDMGTEELGSVYESLLELVPIVRVDSRHFGFVGDAALGEEGGERPARGHARKLTGSYYTPDSLVQALLDSALDPVAQRAESSADPEHALLSLAVLDPACGSGHFLLGAARRLAARLARVRSEGTPPPAAYRTALRDVITHCIYGVDKNAMAIELARIALWLEAIDPGRPLAFLDHHLVHGDALLGVLDPSLLDDGIPDGAYAALTGDDKAVVKELKKQNAAARKQLERERKGGQITFSFKTDEWAQALAAVDAMPDGSLAEVAEKEAALRRVMESDANRSRFAQDAYVAAFLLPKTAATKGSVPTTATLRDVAAGVTPPRAMVEAVTEVARNTPFLHWSVTFAPVMARGGFDCVLGNPPWEKVKLSEKEFFSSRDERIATAPNKAQRQKLIDELAAAAPGSPERRLFEAFGRAKQEAEGASSFARCSGRFPLTGAGDINFYALFAETALGAIRRDGRAGLVLPSGIATDAGTAAFFREISAGRLVSLIDFENRDALFESVHRSYKFCLLTIGKSERPTFAFFLTQPEQRFDERRRFTLTPDDLARLNPNTRTAPIFRSQADAELTAKIYRNVPVLWDETREDGNPWGLSFATMFHMSNDSHLFRTAPGPGLVPLYEAKMIHQFDHRFATYTGGDEDSTREVTEEEKQDPDFRVRPRYWVPEKEVEARLRDRGWNKPWLLGWRDICRATDERTVIASVIPRVGVGNTLPLLFPNSSIDALHVACLLATLCSLVLDYVARQKVGGTHLNFYLAKQLPVPRPDQFNHSLIGDIAVRVAALSSGADMARFRDALCGIPASRPLQTDEAPVIRAELDAMLAHRFGLDRDDLRFVLDPSERFGDPSYPTETFRVLKENEIQRYGEYRTRRLVLEAWDRLTAETVRPTAAPAAPPLVSPDEDMAFVTIALVLANGGSIDRVALARAVS